MRRGTIVAGIAVGVLTTGGAAVASAASSPVAVVFVQGTTTAGSLPAATSASSAAPASFQGTIDSASATLAGTFPKASIVLPPATIPSVALTGFAAAPITITSTPATDFTGKLNAANVSYDLSGTVGYSFSSTVGGVAHVCNSQAPLPLTLTGSTIDFTTGGYGAKGSQTSLVLTAGNIATDTLYCAALSAKIAPIAGQIASSFTGYLSIPGVIPVPTATTPATPTIPTTPATPTTTPATPTATKTGALRLTVSRPATVKRGRSTVTKVVVTNTGAGTARSVAVRLAASGSGVSPRSKSATYASIGAGKSRTFSVRLRTTKRTAKRSAVKVTAKGAGGLSAAASTTLRLR